MHSYGPHISDVILTVYVTQSSLQTSNTFVVIVDSVGNYSAVLSFWTYTSCDVMIPSSVCTCFWTL